MRKIQEVLRLKWGRQLSNRQMAVFLCSDRAKCITGVTLAGDAKFSVEGGGKGYGYE
jgi:hypothetical protein